MEKMSVLFISLLLLLFTAGNGFANKSSVKIEAPESVKKGTEITIKVHVSHMGNSKRHFTNLVTVKINGKEIKKWEFTPEKRPEGAKFTVELKYKVEENIEIVAEANCSKHGSKGPEKLKVAVK